MPGFLSARLCGKRDDERGDWFDKAMEVRELIRKARGNRPAPDIDQLFTAMRDERAVELLNHLRRR